MRIEFDPAKSAKNALERGLPFTIVDLFDFDTALRREDMRKDYRETRITAYGMIGTRLHVLCFKPMGPDHIRVISLRKANERERRRYEEEKETQAIDR